MKLYTIGFTKKSARQFFDLLKSHGVEYLIDIRLHPDGQLAGFTKKEDLRYFLKEIIGCNYLHLSALAPSDELLKTYREDHDWQKYEVGFERLMEERGIPDILDRVLFEEKACCLLCSEPTPEQCHRRLVAEHLANSWENVSVTHL
ncbi:MAG: DUF488 domain-containing protein [Chloroflexi bacterium]|nr:DUF488 domain-containing protein [Chloroflexota bacterium]